MLVKDLHVGGEGAYVLAMKKRLLKLEKYYAFVR